MRASWPARPSELLRWRHVDTADRSINRRSPSNSCGAPAQLFEGQFPVDGVSSTDAALWYAFKRLAAGASAAVKAALLAGTPRRVYWL